MVRSIGLATVTAGGGGGPPPGGWLWPQPANSRRKQHKGGGEPQMRMRESWDLCCQQIADVAMR